MINALAEMGLSGVGIYDRIFISDLISTAGEYEQIVNSQKMTLKMAIFEIVRKIPAKKGLESRHLSHLLRGGVEMEIARYRALTHHGHQI